MRKSKYTQEALQSAVSVSNTMAGVLRELGIRQSGGSQAHIKRLINQYQIDTSHFTGQSHWSGKERSELKKSTEQYLVLQDSSEPKISTVYLRRAMLESGVVEECSMCGLGNEWHGRPLTLQIDHIDGNRWNNLLENLRFLCPNCHTQTDTWGYNNVRVAELADALS